MLKKILVFIFSPIFVVVVIESLWQPPVSAYMKYIWYIFNSWIYLINMLVRVQLKYVLFFIFAWLNLPQYL
jgi:hypothetical protein